MTDYREEQMLSIQAAADLLSVSTRTVRRLIDKRELSHVKINRRVLIKLSDVVDLSQSRTVSQCEAQRLAKEILERF